MKFVSWNVNGLRACMNKGFLDAFYALNADFFCLQETKLQEGQISLDLPGYQQFWCYAQKKGYSGTAVFTKHMPLSVSYGLGVEELDTEGRLITLEYEEFYLVNCYTPNAQRGLARIDHRLRWEAALRSYLNGLDARKPVIYCGDLNVAHQEIDLKNPSSNRGNAGFSDEERGAFATLLESGFTDSFRHLYPDQTGAYSWWSYMFNARQNNAGWRIDYFVVSDRLAGSIHDATIHPDVLGSDHCPVGLDLNITCNGGIWSPEITVPEKEEQTKADGESPAGHIRRVVPLAVSFSIAFLLLAPAVWLMGNHTASPDETQPSRTQAPQETGPFLEDKTLVTAIVDYGKNMELVTEHYDEYLYSSYIPRYLTNGDKKWELFSGSYLWGSNFHTQFIFNPEFKFTGQNKPNVTYEGDGIIYLQYYYGDDRSIEGFFLSGYLEDTETLRITVEYPNILPNTYSLTVIPDFDLSEYTTEDLANAIQTSGNIHVSMLSSQYTPMETLIQTDPYILELTTRPDAIAVLLDVYEENELISLNCVSHLLYYEPFNSMMTEAEIERYNAITEAKRSKQGEY